MVSDPEGADTFASIHYRSPSPVIPETDASAAVIRDRLAMPARGPG